jgi:ribosomal protein L11 methyltransferase
MTPEKWTIRIENYHPVDEGMEERLRRVMAEMDRLPESAVHVDEVAGVITIDYSRVKGRSDALKEILHTVRVSERIVIKPPWESYQPAAGEIVLDIDPGASFGSGLHQTTRLCLQALEKYLRQGCSTADLGTGSGILAIAAARLGAARVTAVEVDPEAVEAAKANVERNCVGKVVEVLRGECLDGTASEIDVVTANIVAEIIVDHLHELSLAIKEGGILICSGMTDRNAGDVEKALPGAGFRVIEKLTESHWVALVALNQLPRKGNI